MAKRIIGLKHPSLDILCDVDLKKFQEKFVTVRNPCIFTWSGEHMKVIPFEACEDFEMEIPRSNFAWIYEPVEKVAKYHDSIMKDRKEREPALLTKEEHQAYLAKKQKEVANIVKRNK